MNLFRQKIITASAGWLVAVWFGFLSIGHAQTNGGGARWLLVFDSSAKAKKLFPATEAAVNRFFFMRAGGELENGDSVGVWILDQQINAQLPTFTWSAGAAAESASNIVSFLGAQSSHAETGLPLLPVPLNHVVSDSERLTVVLFTDGQHQISGTPYDLGINQTFQSTREDRRKTRQPVVVVLRGQLGKFAGCTVNFPPGDLNLPAFPPLPAPPPAPVVTPPTPAPPVPSLVIVGTHVSTNLDEPVPAELAKTNPVVAPSNSPPVKAEIKPVVPPTNVPVSIAKSAPESGSTNIIYSVVVLLMAGLLVVVVLVLRSRRQPESSLITSSMEDDERRK
jgi:hypothetical protein